MPRHSHFLAYLLLVLAPILVTAAEHSPTLDNRIAMTPRGEPIPVILFLDFRLSMDDVYPVAITLPMEQRREYVVDALQRRFEEMCPRVMQRLDQARKEGKVGILRPLWILNAIRVSATEDVIADIDQNFSEVTYIANDAAYDNTLDTGWGVVDIGAPRVWTELGVDGSGVIVGHKDAGLDRLHPGFDGHIWVNPGEDLNGNGTIDEPEINGVDDDGNGYVDDFYGWNFDNDNNDITDAPGGGGHGTKTGSVISANAYPCDTISVAPGAKLMELRAWITQGSVFEASQYAILMGANVISASLSFKMADCSANRDCPNFVAHRWVSEMELAAGLIHANSAGNQTNPPAIIPLAVSAPANSPPPAMTPGHEQQGGVSSMVGVSGYNQGGSWYSSSMRGPSAWSRADICVDARMPFCDPDGSVNAYPADFEDYPYENGTNPGLAKPDVSSPTNTPSLFPGGGCSSIGGTSGACPHVGGTLALIYSAFPGITPEDAYRLLIASVQDNGEAGFDSLYGFGMLRAFGACSTGVAMRAIVAGIVSDPNGDPVVRARVFTNDVQPVFTDESGSYTVSLDAGSYTLLYDRYGFADHTEEVVLAAGQTLVLDVQLAPAAAASAHGTVTAGGVPLAGISVQIPEADLSVTTDAGGNYQFSNIYAGTYAFVVGGLPWETLNDEQTVTAGDNTLNFQLARSPEAYPSGPDAYGYIIYDNWDAESVVYDWIEVAPSQGGPGTGLGISNDGSAVINLPFTVRFYGQDYSDITVCENGLVLFGPGSSNEWGPYTIPHPEAPNGFVAPYFTDWWLSSGGQAAYYIDAANHRVILEWYNVLDYYQVIRATFEVIIGESGYPPTPTSDSRMICQYKRVQGSFPGLIGLENQSGTDGIQYEFETRDVHASPIDSGSVLVITTDSTLLTDHNSATLPLEYSLKPNFPNPFNSTTTFSWDVPRAGFVRLALYDILGREAAVVFSGQSAGGHFAKTYDARVLSSGVYFARLEAGGKSIAVRKVLLLK